MITFAPLTQLDRTTLQNVMSGYVSEQVYQVRWRENATLTSFSLELRQRAQPYHKHFDHLDDDSMQRYCAALPAGYSFGAFDDTQLVGVVLAEPHKWNQSVWVWEFHVAATHRGIGIGRRLMEMLAQLAHTNGIRTIVCETQNTNVPAIQVYRTLGFRLEGVDISYYSNQDYPEGEVAVFMKRQLSE